MKFPVLCVLMVAVFLPSFSCKDSGNLLDFGNVNNPHVRWKAYGLSNYEMIQSLTCFCAYHGAYKVIVRNNLVSDVIDTTDGTSLPPAAKQLFKTVDELFAIVESINPTTVAHFAVEYDPLYGFPSFSVDPDSHIADEEYGYAVRDLTH